MLPAFYDKTFTLRLKLPELKSSFNASWHVAIFNKTTSELISEDHAVWKYAAEKAMKTNVKELEKNIILILSSLFSSYYLLYYSNVLLVW